MQKQSTKAAWYQTRLLPLDGTRKEIEMQRAHFFSSDAVLNFTSTEYRAATYYSSFNFACLC